MTDTLHSELLRIVQAIAFPAPGTVALAGRSAPQTGAAFAMPTTPPNPLVAALQQLLYDWCYCRRFDGAAASSPTASASDPMFIEHVSTANAGRDRWDPGWQITQILPSNQIVAVKGAMTRMIWPGEFLTPGAPGGPPRPGAEISLYAPKESRTMQPGFYFAFGEALSDQEDDFSIVRFYFNVEAAGAARLIGAVTSALNRFAIPFRCKCLSMAELYGRTDAAVLYVAKRYYQLAAVLLADAYPAVRPLLKPATPLFSKRLAEGIGFAENPKTAESFGMHRCRIVAEAVCGAHARGIDEPQARINEIASAFAATGLSLDRPFLNPGSTDRYAFRESAAA